MKQAMSTICIVLLCALAMAGLASLGSGHFSQQLKGALIALPIAIFSGVVGIYGGAFITKKLISDDDTAVSIGGGIGFLAGVFLILPIVGGIVNNMIK